MHVSFWFEFASTYSYPAAMRIQRLAAERSVTVVWKAFLLGPIFAAQGWRDSPFNVYPAKGRYMWRDLERVCARYDLAFRKPSTFPRRSLTAARVARVAGAEPWLPDFVRAVYRANFVEDRPIDEPALIAEILAGLGLPGEDIVAEAATADAKTRLRRRSEEAAGLGIFGAPTMIVAGEMFWGNDRLEDALDWAAGNRSGALEASSPPPP